MSSRAPNLIETLSSRSTSEEPIQHHIYQGIHNTPVEIIVLRAGAYTALVNHMGARLLALWGPDQENLIVSVLEAEDIVADQAAMGACVGRVCNRIKHGELIVPHQATYQLPQNDGQNHLHGGPGGFHKRLWTHGSAAWDAVQRQASIELHLTSRDGDQGYPGNVQVTVAYSLSAAGELKIVFNSQVHGAISPLNLTHHAYWNLAGSASSPDILQQVLTSSCDRYLQTDHEGIPTGNIMNVEGTCFDFRQPRPLGAFQTAAAHDIASKGYDVYLLRKDADPSRRTLPLQQIASVTDPGSGRALELWSDQPGFQLYTGNGLGGQFHPYQGFCLEPSALIDAVHHQHFPSILVPPGQGLQQTMLYRFKIPS